MNNSLFDVIIIGGSYSGLSAAMSLGRSMRDVLIIDDGKPCNRKAPHSHNFITHDGHPPAQIAREAKAQVEKYDTIKFYKGLASKAFKSEEGFQVLTESGDTFNTKKLIITRGLNDIMPEIKGFAECWGVSIIHCPYCHGYEVRHEKTGILANGDAAFHYGQLISNWTKELVIFTNGKSSIKEEHKSILQRHQIQVIETEVDTLIHDQGQVQQVLLKDGTQVEVKAIYHKPDFTQSTIISDLGCEFTEQGLVKVDPFQRTSVPGVYASGDNSTLRGVALAVASGNLAGIWANNDMIFEGF